MVPRRSNKKTKHSRKMSNKNKNKNKINSTKVSSSLKDMVSLMNDIPQVNTYNSMMKKKLVVPKGKNRASETSAPSTSVRGYSIQSNSTKPVTKLTYYENGKVYKREIPNELVMKILNDMEKTRTERIRPSCMKMPITARRSIVPVSPIVIQSRPQTLSYGMMRPNQLVNNDRNSTRISDNEFTGLVRSLKRSNRRQITPRRTTRKTSKSRRKLTRRKSKKKRPIQTKKKVNPLKRKTLVKNKNTRRRRKSKPKSTGWFG